MRPYHVVKILQLQSFRPHDRMRPQIGPLRSCITLNAWLQEKFRPQWPHVAAILLWLRLQYLQLRKASIFRNTVMTSRMAKTAMWSYTNTSSNCTLTPEIVTSIFTHPLYSYMTPHFMDSEPLSNDTIVRELLAKTLVVGANRTQEWIDTTGVYWTKNGSLWHLVGAHPSMDQYRVSQSHLFCKCCICF